MDFMENQQPSQTSGPKHAAGFFIRGIGSILIVVAVFYFGYQSGRQGFIFEPKEFKVINQNQAPATADYNLLWEAIKVVNEKYIEKPLDQQKILQGAVKGAVEALGDPYTTFFPPKDLKNFQDQLKGSFGGIGAEVGKKEGNIVVVAPLDGTPAKRAGILAGDIVVQVDGQSTQGWSVEKAVEKIRGPKGTSVTLNIFRGSKDASASLGAGKPFDIKIVRDTIIIRSVKWEFKEAEAGGEKKTVAVLKIIDFGDDTQGLFNKAINEILSRKVAGIIVDLRNNPGGYLQTAVTVASAWVKSDDLVVTEARSQGDPIKYNSEGNNRLADIKTVVLINGGSASASEILAGALRDHNIAKLIGEKSFGKGSVQELVNLKEGNAVKVTVAKWITPGGKNINHNGLEPDIKVELTEEGIKAGQDLQMDKAIEEIIK